MKRVIYGVALATPGLKADHGKPLRGVYVDATRSLIQHSNSLDEFWWLTINCEKFLSSDFPSWVRGPRTVNQKQPSIPEPGSSPFLDDKRLYHAAGQDESKSRAQIEFRRDSNALSVNRLLVDEITFVGNAPNGCESTPEDTRLLARNRVLAETVTMWHDVDILKRVDTAD
jgi:hypothetical protein